MNDISSSGMISQGLNGTKVQNGGGKNNKKEKTQNDQTFNLCMINESTFAVI